VSRCVYSCVCVCVCQCIYACVWTRAVQGCMHSCACLSCESVHMCVFGLPLWTCARNCKCVYNLKVHLCVCVRVCVCLCVCVCVCVCVCMCVCVCVCVFKLRKCMHGRDAGRCAFWFGYVPFGSSTDAHQNLAVMHIKLCTSTHHLWTGGAHVGSARPLQRTVQAFIVQQAWLSSPCHSTQQAKCMSSDVCCFLHRVIVI